MTRIAIVGVGKIARDQHIPAIANSDAFELVATASPNSSVDGVPGYTDVDDMLAREPGIQAVSMCQPPQPRFAAAKAAIAAGKHVFLEKPPGATLSEVEALTRAADQAGVTLFASWHSRYAAAVAPARAWLADKKVRSAAIRWKEDVRHWHPGQDWIWRAGGLGVFDPGINALSILTAILPGPVHLETARLEIPSNRQAPIAAQLGLRGDAGCAITAEFDWRQTGQQTWDIDVATDAGDLRLTDGGARLVIGGVDQSLTGPGEYSGLYARFAELVRNAESDVDLAPLTLVADAFLNGEVAHVAAFED